ncbi:AraC family transcriptional regulator [Sphingobacterium deserti]|uniref:Transcriptional regulator AraC family protein n=1 Tax=Sphingobacterium deserti TaxID=1229276 RepID=A0A0B8T3C1_9SPHI|nr:helix-turn-helix domain-containing protein [Sphingobacterium deserti]KGE13528.1 transcriptional regulator AraC family protein [Sphingobacterium deserti]
MKHAKTSFWLGTNNQQAILQEFDGQHAYLQLLETNIRSPLSLSIAITRPDLHALYLLTADEPISLFPAILPDPGILSVGEACFLYLPKGDFSVYLGSGQSQLFIFAFRATLFRKESDHPYAFIRPLVHAYRTQATAAEATSPYRIDKRSEDLITRLCSSLHSRRLGNDQYILGKVIELIQFAHEAISAARGTQQHEKRLAKEAYTLLRHYVNEEGQQVRITRLAKELGLSGRYIHQLLRTYYGQSGQKLKEQLLLEKSKALLSDGYTVKECAYSCGYSSMEAFHHFFKKHMQETPSNYRARRLRKCN